eukprot:scaffold246316_cov24-Prasinocladus_malaysianus.AAC.1
MIDNASWTDSSTSTSRNFNHSVACFCINLRSQTQAVSQTDRQTVIYKRLRMYNTHCRALGNAYYTSDLMYPVSQLHGMLIKLKLVGPSAVKQIGCADSILALT